MHRKTLLPVFFLLCCIIISGKSEDDKYLAIRATDYPSDMAYIEGNDSMQSFYIGRTEECNRNYLIYMQWIKRVFGYDYPNVYEKSIPDTTVWANEIKMNDPSVTNYLFHPAFAYYPVTGVSWLQAEYYCHWKGDRYNEYILMREGVLRFNPSQVNEDNFATEAYLAGQYEGLVRAALYNKDTHDTTKVLFRHHILVPEFRLPTEAEWEYAAAYAGKIKTNSKQLYTKRYFLNKWKKYYDEDNMECYRNHLASNTMEFFDITNQENKNSLNSFTLFSDVRSELPLAHMDDNVQEWVYEMEGRERTKEEKDLLFIYAICLQPLIDAGDMDENGNYTEKDSLGMMNFVYLCDDNKGKPVLVRQYRPGWDAHTHVPSEIKRIYRGGDNQNKSTKSRNSLPENFSSPHIGFRCALTMMRK